METDEILVERRRGTLYPPPFIGFPLSRNALRPIDPP
jgi:hypothetical protein